MWRRTVSGGGTVRHAPPYQRRSSLRERNEPHPGWRGGAGIGQTGLKYRRRYMRRRTEISDSTPGSKLGRRLTRGTQLRGMEGETTSSVDWRGVKGRSTKQRSGVRRVGGSGVLGSGNRRVSARTLRQEVNERRSRAENPRALRAFGSRPIHELRTHEPCGTWVRGLRSDRLHPRVPMGPGDASQPISVSPYGLIDPLNAS